MFLGDDIVSLASADNSSFPRGILCLALTPFLSRLFLGVQRWSCIGKLLGSNVLARMYRWTGKRLIKA
jgi:hypothetical protein